MTTRRPYGDAINGYPIALKQSNWGDIVSSKGSPKTPEQMEIPFIQFLATEHLENTPAHFQK